MMGMGRRERSSLANQEIALEFTISLLNINYGAKKQPQDYPR